MSQKIIDILGPAIGTAVLILAFYGQAVFAAQDPGYESLVWFKSIFQGWFWFSFIVEGTQIEAFLSARSYRWADLWYWHWNDTFFDVFFANALLGGIVGAILMGIVS